MDWSDKIIDLVAVAIIFAFAIKEFFSYLKGRKPQDTNKEVVSELKLMNSNHLHAIQECIEKGNCQLVATIHNDNTKMIEILGEINGKLSK